MTALKQRELMLVVLLFSVVGAVRPSLALQPLQALRGDRQVCMENICSEARILQYFGACMRLVMHNERAWAVMAAVTFK
jgi:hypothetical protein